MPTIKAAHGVPYKVYASTLSSILEKVMQFGGPRGDRAGSEVKINLPAIVIDT
jgi:hypothetical protein